MIRPTQIILALQYLPFPPTWRYSQKFAKPHTPTRDSKNRCKLSLFFDLPPDLLLRGSTSSRHQPPCRPSLMCTITWCHSFLPKTELDVQRSRAGQLPQPPLSPSRQTFTDTSPSPKFEPWTTRARVTDASRNPTRLTISKNVCHCSLSRTLKRYFPNFILPWNVFRDFVNDVVDRGQINPRPRGLRNRILSTEILVRDIFRYFCVRCLGHEWRWEKFRFLRFLFCQKFSEKSSQVSFRRVGPSSPSSRKEKITFSKVLAILFDASPISGKGSGSLWLRGRSRKASGSKKGWTRNCGTVPYVGAGVATSSNTKTNVSKHQKSSKIRKEEDFLPQKHFCY